jgi:hypothetical protein
VKLKFSRLKVGAILVIALASTTANALTTNFVTFDPSSQGTITTTSNPGGVAINQGPSIYVSVPEMQTINTTPATFSGGVILGLATNFPAIQFASGVNVYGTADFGNNLSNTLSISTNLPTTEVSFALFNGETFAQTYTINAFDVNSQLIGTQTITNIAPNWQSGYGLVDLIFPTISDPASFQNISSVTINATNSGQPVTQGPWDFLIDSVAFNQNITSLYPTNPPPPNPSTVITTTNPANPSTPIYIPKSVVVQSETTNKLITVVDNGNGNNSQIQRGKHQIKVRDGVIENEIFLKQKSTITTPVPEPESYAMILAGLGVMGCVARRRRVVK